MMENKPKGWKETLDDLIRANFTYEDSNMALKKKYGDEGTLGGLDYRERKNELTGGEKADEKIDELGTRKRGKQQPKPAPAWSKGKQQTADTSQLAKIINMGVYQGLMPMCANKELKEEDVQAVNPGGAVVATISYYFPEQKMDHPIVILGIRVVILYIKFKSVCSRVQKTVENITHIGTTKGMKANMTTEMRK
jgi:hypothetical protein